MIHASWDTITLGDWHKDWHKTRAKPLKYRGEELNPSSPAQNHGLPSRLTEVHFLLYLCEFPSFWMFRLNPSYFVKIPPFSDRIGIKIGIKNGIQKCRIYAGFAAVSGNNKAPVKGHSWSQREFTLE